MKYCDTACEDDGIGPRRGVARMLAQMQLQPAARDLHVERQIGFEAMLPIHFHAQEPEIVFARLVDIEDAEDRRRPLEPQAGLRLLLGCRIDPG